MSSEILIQSLLNNTKYPHDVKNIRLIQTHISWLILTGKYVYKIKKPFDFKFLDFSTLEKRKHFCEKEVRLNRLLSPEIYEEVVSITGTEEKPEINGTGTAIEYALRMQEFSQDLLFSGLLKENKLTMDMMEQLAILVAKFHMATPVADPKSRFGTPEHVMTPVIQNFDQVKPFLKDEADLKQLAILRKWAEEKFQKNYDFFKVRKEKGFIRDCHGDLHMGNIVFYHNKPMLFDRIEFNDDFRWTEVMADLGFLVMDLMDHQRKDLAYRLINAYFMVTGDYEALKILPFNIAYRAMVRAKISLFGLHQLGLTEEDKKNIYQKYREFTALAEQAMHFPEPQLIITHGLMGTGKSFVARQLAEKEGMIHINSDVERKRLSGFAFDAKTKSGVNQGIYDPKISEKTYDHLKNVAAEIIHAGFPVIVDATFLKKSQRDAFVKLAMQLKVPFHILNCELPREEILKRLQKRSEEVNNPSEADITVFEMLEKSAEPLTIDEKKYLRN